MCVFRHFSKPTKKPTQISSSSVPEMEVSVFDDLKDEITRPDVEANTDTGRNQLEENPDNVDKQENKVNRNSIGRDLVRILILQVLSVSRIFPYYP